jgi:hypothetical protein
VLYAVATTGLDEQAREAFDVRLDVEAWTILPSQAATIRRERGAPAWWRGDDQAATDAVALYRELSGT